MRQESYGNLKTYFLQLWNAEKYLKMHNTSNLALNLLKPASKPQKVLLLSTKTGIWGYTGERLTDTRQLKKTIIWFFSSFCTCLLTTIFISLVSHSSLSPTFGFLLEENVCEDLPVQLQEKWQRQSGSDVKWEGLVHSWHSSSS